METDASQEHIRILEMIDSGRISAEQGLLLLQALNTADAENGGGDFTPAPQTWQLRPSDAALPGVDEPGFASPAGASAEPLESLSARALRLKRLWVIPMGAGVILAVVSGVLMYAALQRNQGDIGVWYVCAAVPFTLGLLVMLLAWSSRRAPWLHLRVQQARGEKPQRIALSFPLPVTAGAWFVRLFGRWIPGLRDQPVEDLLRVVQQTAVSGEPIHIEVDEGDAGEKVEIFIG